LPRPVSGEIGDYELIEMVRRGGQGVIYKARHKTVGRVVALKTLRVDADEDSVAAHRFTREIQAAANLTHRHIVPVYEVGVHDGRPYYAMPFYTGGSLADHRERYQADARAAVALMEKVARAVDYGHGHKIMHRDLKPGNVLLDEDGEPLVSDFGLAKLQDGETELTRMGDILGTTPYMSPEQADGRLDQLGPPTDVWALGVMLYELLTGRRPFMGGNSEEIKRHIRQSDPPRPRLVKAGLDRSLETIVLGCLEKDPARRYRSAGALADDLANWLRGEPISRRPEPVLRRAVRWVRRNPGKCALAALTAVLAATAVTILTVMHYTDPARYVRIYQRELAAGNPVTLIGETGGPRWYAWASREGLFDTAEGVHKPFSLRSDGNCLLELMPDSGVSSYRLRAEVNHRYNNFDGQAGIYFCRVARAGTQVFCSLLFDDIEPNRPPPLPPRPPPTNVYFDVQAMRPEEFGPVVKRHIHSGRPFEPVGRGHEHWRQLATDITPERIRVWIDGKLFAEASIPDMEMACQRMLRDLPDLAQSLPAVPSRRGFGLYVSKGAAAFRNVTIDPVVHGR
jgi:serine/threonine-protein kinase